MTTQRPQARPAAQAPVATPAEVMVGLLRDLVDAQYRTNELLADLVAVQDDAELYCPPYEYCPGGVRLMRSTKFDEKTTPEQRRDKFYHPLPEAMWHDVVTDVATFHAKNHTVWRSKAVHLGDGGDEPAADPFPDEPEGYRPPPPKADPVTGEIMESGPVETAPRNAGELMRWASEYHGLNRGGVFEALGRKNTGRPTDFDGMDFAAAQRTIIRALTAAR